VTATRTFCCKPAAASATSGDYLVEVEGIDGRSHFMHLLTYLPGTPLGELSYRPPTLLPFFYRSGIKATVINFLNFLVTSSSLMRPAVLLRVL
jgi:hypothetical protein